MSKRRREEPKRISSKWEKENQRRRILQATIVIVIIAAMIIVGYGYYADRIKPWHQPIVRVNDRVFDMRYFVNMLRLWGAGQNALQDIELAQSLVPAIQTNELVKQGAAEVGILANQTGIEAETKAFFSFNPEEESEEDFALRIQEFLDGFDISRRALELILIEPMLLQPELREYLGNRDYPEDGLFQHVKVQAILLGTEEEALEARGKWETEGTEGFDQLINASSPRRYYPKDSLEWLPLGIESSVFDEFAFSDGVVETGISAPIRDTTYYTTGAYWLLEILEETGEGEEKSLHMKGILLDSNVTAVDLRDQIAAGGAFDELAKEHSLHSASKDSGGDMGSLSLDDVKSRFGEDNLDYVLGLGPDNLSQPIRTETTKQSGYWLIKVLETNDRALSDNHRETLISQVFRDWVEDETESEDNRIEDYLDSDRLFWAISHVKP